MDYSWLQDELDALATKIHNLSPGDVGSFDRVLLPIAQAKAAIQSRIDEHYIGKGEACTSCNGEGDYHDPTGEWRGKCEGCNGTGEARIFTESEVEQRCIEARNNAVSTIYGIANDLANKDPQAIGSVSLAPYFANAVAIYREYLRGGNYERIDWKSLNLPTLSTNNKVTLADVASPNPSPEAQRAIQGAVDRSMEIQRNIGKDTLERSSDDTQ